jgi:hypothetical protein
MLGIRHWQNRRERYRSADNLLPRSNSRHKREGLAMSEVDTQARSLHDLYGEKEQPWSERTEPIIRFWESDSGECWGMLQHPAFEGEGLERPRHRS